MTIKNHLKAAIISLSNKRNFFLYRAVLKLDFHYTLRVEASCFSVKVEDLKYFKHELCTPMHNYNPVSLGRYSSYSPEVLLGDFLVLSFELKLK